MKKNNLLFGLISTSFLLLAGFAFYSRSDGSFASRIFNSNDQEDYKMVLNKDNAATYEEIGNFSNPKTSNKTATRKTALGNDIVFQFETGKGVTNNDYPSAATKFCQMPGSQYGWITNINPLTGIKKIKLNVQQASAKFRVDLSTTGSLEKYYYSSSDTPNLSYRTDEYTGSNTYELPFSGNYKHFRLQNLGSSALSLTSLEIYYSCSVEEDAPRGVLKTNSDPIDILPVSVKLGGQITVDYKYVDPVTDSSNGFTMFLGDSDTTRYGGYKLYKDSIETTYDGVAFEKLSDGYNRVTFDVGELSNVRSGETVPTIINSVMFKWYEPTKGVYFDITCEPVASNRGVFNKSSNYSSIQLSEPYTVSEGGTLIVDYKFVNPIADKNNGISMFFGSDSSNRFGNYKLFRYSLETTYNGITFEALDDCYFRMTIDVSLLTNVRSGENKPTVISEVSFKWFEVENGIYFDVNPQNRVEKTNQLQMDDNDFVVANFTDIHVDNASLITDSGTTGKTIKYAIQNSNPDMIVLSGDIAGSASDMSYLCNYLDSFKIPYFVILGNHDHEGSLGYDTIASYLNNSKYGYIEKGPTTLGSEGNYTVQIKNSSGTLVHGFVMMDTGNKYTVTDDSLVEYVSNPISGVSYGSYGGKKTYCATGWNGLRGDQITWYSNAVEGLGCDTSLFCHIPCLEFCKAYEQYQDAVNRNNAADIAACAPIGQCHMGEQVCGSIEQLGLFAAVKASDSTRNIISGHDHCNDFSLLYEGVRLTYALKVGEGSYWKTDGSICGYTELTIDNTGATTLDQIYYNPLS